MAVDNDWTTLNHFSYRNLSSLTFLNYLIIELILNINLIIKIFLFFQDYPRYSLLKWLNCVIISNHTSGDHTFIEKKNSKEIIKSIFVLSFKSINWVYNILFFD